MKALAIDSAVSRLTISAKNDDYFVSTIFDIGMKQSETLLPAIDYVLGKLNITENCSGICGTSNATLTSKVSMPSFST